MNPANILNVIDVATPCHADWDGMTGDDRSRFCGQCAKHVYNLSAMPSAEVVQLIRDKEGDLCVRLFRRTDGTVLNGDCPVGVGRLWMRLKRLATGVAAVCLAGVGSQLLPNALATSAPPAVTAGVGAPTESLRDCWHDLVDEVRAWLGLPPWYAQPVAGMMLMGDICLPPPTSVPGPPVSAVPLEPLAPEGGSGP